MLHIVWTPVDTVCFFGIRRQIVHRTEYRDDKRDASRLWSSSVTYQIQSPTIFKQCQMWSNQEDKFA